jgi:hypothetical protein
VPRSAKSSSNARWRWTNPRITLGKLKIIVLMLLWSQGKEPDALMFDELFGADDDDDVCGAAPPALKHIVLTIERHAEASFFFALMKEKARP